MLQSKIQTTNSYEKIIIQPRDTLYKRLGSQWKIIYDLDINKAFRKKHPDPNKIASQSVIFAPVFGKVENAQNHKAIIIGYNTMGDNISATPLVKYFKNKNYKTFFCVNKIWAPLFRDCRCIDRIIESDYVGDDLTYDEIINCYEDGDIIVTCHVYDKRLFYENKYKVLSHITPTGYNGDFQIAYTCSDMSIAKRLFYRLRIHYPDLNTAFSFDEMDLELPPKSVLIITGSIYFKERSIQPSVMHRLYGLMEQNGYVPFLIVNKNDTEAIKELYHLRKFECKFFDTQNLMYCINMVRQADLIITPDTGLLHIAQNFKKEIIILTGMQRRKDAIPLVELSNNMFIIKSYFVMRDYDEEVPVSFYDDLLYQTKQILN